MKPLMNEIKQAMARVARFGALGKTPDPDGIDKPPRRSKHQTHVRKRVKGIRRSIHAATAKAICEPAGSKLAKRFAKGAIRGPRGF